MNTKLFKKAVRGAYLDYYGVNISDICVDRIIHYYKELTTDTRKDTMYYLHLDNGDWNCKSDSLAELLSNIEFEIRSGGAKRLMVTINPLPDHPINGAAND
jgi:hypothetical protein